MFVAKAVLFKNVFASFSAWVTSAGSTKNLISTGVITEPENNSTFQYLPINQVPLMVGEPPKDAIDDVPGKSVIDTTAENELPFFFIANKYSSGAPAAA